FSSSPGVTLLVISMLRPPLISTLFPYTTLFRSGRVDASCGGGVGDAGAGAQGGGSGAGPVGGRPRGADRKTPGHARERSSGARADRKSTRLNSSHQIISYAVFCLKKKKEKQPRT